MSNNNKVWMKKSCTSFDVTMGSYDGLLLFSNIIEILPEAGIYRDDGLAVTNKSGPDIMREEEDLRVIFQKYNLKITVEVGMKTTDFLDVQFNLSTESYRPYHKTNSSPAYINTLSNPPPNIITALPGMVESRLGKISSSKNEFDKEAPLYLNALKKAGYTDAKLEFKNTKKKLKQEKGASFGSTHHGPRMSNPTSRKCLGT
jgi:hypothetical protein